jgi:hypothetical protein
MREVSIFIEGITANEYTKIDLFKDESISINSSIQNIQDLAKVYTDFSQSFTVPATEKNNKIFEYFYQNDVDNAIDHNLRRFAYIEVGYTPFRTGKIQLEGSSIKNGRIEFYTITFYGDLVSLKDRFGATKIADLDYSFISNTYSGAEVKDRIEDVATDYDVRYPLISSNRVWSYGDGTSTDLTMPTTGRLEYDELNPAIKVSKIFQAIQNDFDITLNGMFLTDERFTKLFLWCKNSEGLNMTTETKVVDMSYTDNSTYFDITLNTLSIDYMSSINISGTDYAVDLGLHKIDISMYNVTDTTAIYYIEVYINDVLDQTIQGSGTNVNYSVGNYQNNYGLDKTFKLKIKASNGLSFDAKINYTQILQYDYTGSGDYVQVQQGFYADVNTITLSSNKAFYTMMPDMLVSDFFSGILKEFNLTCYSLGNDTFEIEPLDKWYQKGAVINVTKYIDKDTIAVDRIKLYKNINLNYQKSESFMNRAFGDLNGREYGNAINEFPYDGGEYKVDVPFEDLLFQKFSLTGLQVGYCLTKAPDYKSYIPKPILLYLNGLQSTAIYFFDGTTETTINDVALFGQELYTNNELYSLNFSVDNSSWYGYPIQNSLFATYYYNYISNLFNTKNRLTKCTANFPISLITSLRLNDRLVIEDKRYLINSINSEITSGKVQLELINDLSPILNIPLITGNPDGGTVVVPVVMPNGASLRTLSTTSGGVTFSSSSISTDTNVTVTYGALTDPLTEIITEEIENITTEDGFILMTEQGNASQIVIDILTDYTNGSTSNESIIITL